MELHLSALSTWYINTEEFGDIRGDLYELFSNKLPNSSLNSYLEAIDIIDNRVELKFLIDNAGGFDLVNYTLNQIIDNPKLLEHLMVFILDSDATKLGIIELIGIKSVIRNDDTLCINTGINAYRLVNVG